MEKVILNPGQDIAAKKMQDFFKSSYTRGDHFVLTGGPGTGKTFLTNYAVKGNLSNIAGVAISHAAKNVLQMHLGEKVKCFTLAGFLGLQKSNDDDGKIVFKENSNGFVPMKSFDIMVLDEISMIDDIGYDHIMSIANNTGIKILALGDKYQLPPVEQDNDSKFFDRVDVELTQSMRFGGPIESLANVFRQEISLINQEEYFDKYILNSYTKRENNYDFTGETGYRFTKDINKMMEEAADNFQSNQNNTSHSRILAFKNKSIDKINKGIRKLIYGENLAQFEKGEIIIANSNVYPTGIHTMRLPPIVHNGQILRVDSYIIDDGPYGIRCAYLKLKNVFNPLDRPIRVVSTENGDAELNKYYKKIAELKIKAIADKTQWQSYFDFIGQFLQYDYGYAVNLYRAQGSTIENAYVLDGEVMDVKPLTWKQKFQALYVAMTRPSKNLVFYNKDF